MIEEFFEERLRFLKETRPENWGYIAFGNLREAMPGGELRSRSEELLKKAGIYSLLKDIDEILPGVNYSKEYEKARNNNWANPRFWELVERVYRTLIAKGHEHKRLINLNV